MAIGIKKLNVSQILRKFQGSGSLSAKKGRKMWAQTEN